MTSHDALGDHDPGGVPFSALDPARLRTERTSLKWTRFPADVLPLFVAEMDYAVAPVIQQRLIERVQASDTGYLDGPGELAPVFADFARDRWNWHVDPAQVYLTTDVATGVVEALRVGRPAGGRLVLPTPCYPGFFEMLEEVPFEVLEQPLIGGAGSAIASDSAISSASYRLDLDAFERACQEEGGVDAFLLCNPHNPHGLPHDKADLERLAEIAARYDVFIVSDEIHAPLVYRGATFTPFAPIAAAAGALSVTTTSPSKGWNLAGTKCAVLVPADDRANQVLQQLPPETITRVSILGLHSAIAAYRDARDWLNRAIELLESQDELLATLVAEQLPGVRYIRPSAGTLGWLDFSEAGLGDDPYTRILHDAKVALNNGAPFGAGGAGHVRLNFACAPATLSEAVERIASILPQPASHHEEITR